MHGFKKIAASIKQYIWVLYYAKQDPRVSWKAKIVVIITLAYALSPIDLIPDFIPIVGLIDDLLIIPIGIYIAIKLIPEEVWDDCSRKSKHSIESGELLPKNWVVAAMIAILWLFILIIIGRWLWYAYIV
ncbi:MAG: DUF1232 domain-containing protein [Legionella sp.]|nr:MAG: DUF1232 domain-containing protein [Legionella sp.]